jgi:hypothetical protein
METFGKLTVKLYVYDHLPDQYGRTHGKWKTLLAKWLDRKQVEATLEAFMEANSWLQPKYHEVSVSFICEERISL